MSKTVKKAKKTSQIPFIVVLALTVVLIAGAVVTGVIRGTNENKMNEVWQHQVEIVEAHNQEAQQQYDQAMAEYRQQNTSGANLAWPAQKTEGWDVVNLDNFPLETPRTESVSRYEAMGNGMLLVNEWHSRPDDFAAVESMLVSVSTRSEHKVRVKDGNVKAFPAAVDAVRDCIAEAKTLGYEDYAVWEGYRTFDEQEKLFQKAMYKYKDQLSGEDLIARAKKDVNYPGTSEFNSGLSLTIRLYKKGDDEVNNKAFFESDEGIWMYENSWRYGLVFRFPLADYPVRGAEDKSYKTGVGVKLRAFRYVGKGNAAAMHTLGLCLEEYIEYLMEHRHIAVFENGVLKYEIYREYVGDTSEIQVSYSGSPNVVRHTTSLDNMGYAITVMEY